MLRCTEPDEELTKNHGSDVAVIETILNFYQRHYPRETERLLSLKTRKVVENDVMAENEKCDLGKESSSTDMSKFFPGSVLAKSENNVSFSTFRGDNNCAAAGSHYEDRTKNKLQNLSFYFHNGRQGFRKKV